MQNGMIARSLSNVVRHVGHPRGIRGGTYMRHQSCRVHAVCYVLLLLLPCLVPGSYSQDARTMMNANLKKVPGNLELDWILIVRVPDIECLAIQ